MKPIKVYAALFLMVVLTMSCFASEDSVKKLKAVKQMAKEGNVVQARSTLENMLSTDTNLQDNAEALHQYAILLALSGEIDASDAYFLKAIAASRKGEHDLSMVKVCVQNYIIFLIDCGQTDKVMPLLSEDLFPEDFRNLIMTICKYTNGKMINQIDGRSPFYYLMTLDTNEILGKNLDALNVSIDEAGIVSVNGMPQKVESLEYAQFLYYLGKYKEAEACLRRKIHELPGFGNTVFRLDRYLLWLAKTYRKRGETVMALAMIHSAKKMVRERFGNDVFCVWYWLYEEEYLCYIDMNDGISQTKLVQYLEEEYSKENLLKHERYRAVFMKPSIKENEIE